MRLAPRYLGRGSWLGRRDPRAILLVAVITAVTVIQIWDARIAVALLTLALLYYRTARIPWSSARGAWLFALGFVSVLILLNTLLVGQEIGGIPRERWHVLFTIPVIGRPISAEQVSYGATQLLRFATFISIGFTIAYTIAPSDLGPALARLRIPEKFAYGIDLTFRFIPSLARELQETIDAQRVRGYEWEKRGRTPIGKIQRTVPLMVPLTMNAIVNAEDTIDSMDLRAFGTGKRTWLRQFRYDRTDLAVIFAALAILATVTAANLAGLTRLWVFPVLLELAGA